MEIDVRKRINPIARIVIIKEGYILLSSATKKNERFDSNLLFLPGGHVEHCESAKDTIIREIEEEFENPNDIKVENFLGMLECVWDNNGSPYHEINVVFKGDIKAIDIDNPPQAKEEHIEFSWYKLSDIEMLNILPATFKKAIPKWIGNSSDNLDIFLTEI